MKKSYDWLVGYISGSIRPQERVTDGGYWPGDNGRHVHAQERDVSRRKCHELRGICKPYGSGIRIFGCLGSMTRQPMSMIRLRHWAWICHTVRYEDGENGYSQVDIKEGPDIYRI